MRKRFWMRCVIGRRRVHPGAILQEVLHGAEISQNGLANAMGVSPRRVNEILHGARSITAHTALRLEEVLGLSAEYWMSLQADHDLDMERRKLRPLGPRKPLPEIGPSCAFDAAEREREDLQEPT